MRPFLLASPKDYCGSYPPTSVAIFWPSRPALGPSQAWDCSLQDNRYPVFLDDRWSSAPRLCGASLVSLPTLVVAFPSDLHPSFRTLLQASQSLQQAAKVVSVLPGITPSAFVCRSLCTCLCVFVGGQGKGGVEFLCVSLCVFLCLPTEVRAQPKVSLLRRHPP